MGFSFHREGGHPSEGEITRLVATNVPEGLIVHTKFGVSEKSSGADLSKFGEQYLAELGSNPRWIKASEVGLEWVENKNGQKIKASDKWAEENYVLVSDKE